MFRQRFKSISWSKTLWSLRQLANSPSTTVLQGHGLGGASSKGYQSCQAVALLRSNLLTCRKNFSTEIELSQSEFEDLADETLDSLSEMFEDLQEKFELDPDYDVTFNSGVLTVKISNSWGTYVLNKQSPNKQIWLSSPISGPKRYDFMNGAWIYKHDNSVLHELLTQELCEATNQDVDFTICSFGNS